MGGAGLLRAPCRPHVRRSAWWHLSLAHLLSGPRGKPILNKFHSQGWFTALAGNLPLALRRSFNYLAGAILNSRMKARGLAMHGFYFDILELLPLTTGSPPIGQCSVKVFEPKAAVATVRRTTFDCGGSSAAAPDAEPELPPDHK